MKKLNQDDTCHQEELSFSRSIVAGVLLWRILKVHLETIFDGQNSGRAYTLYMYLEKQKMVNIKCVRFVEG
jgi:hypothetical protein